MNVTRIITLSSLLVLVGWPAHAEPPYAWEPVPDGHRWYQERHHRYDWSYWRNRHAEREARDDRQERREEHREARREEERREHKWW